MKKITLINILLVILLFLYIQINLFSQTHEEITRAIEETNLVYLYEFIQEPEGKDEKLIDIARNAVERYTKYEPAVEKYRTNRMDARARSVGRDLTERLFEDPEKYLQSVVLALVRGLTDPFFKAKVINDWICDNIAYDAEQFRGWANNGQDYISVIKNKKAICGGYAGLFDQMCRLADIESIIITGYSKGFEYTGSLAGTDHAWNAVKISGKWYLVDVTWNAGFMEINSSIKRYTTDYLFLDSRPFLYTHLPFEDKYQFYAPTVTREQFVQEAQIPGAFFRYGLGLRDDLPHYNNIAQGNFRFNLTRRSNNVRLRQELRTPNGQEIQSELTGNIIIYNLPDNREYVGHIFAWFENERSPQSRISINAFEQRIIPQLDRLQERGRITARDKNYFLNAYYKIEENGLYYYLDDQFNTERYNAVMFIHPLVGLTVYHSTSVLTFNIRSR